MRRRPAPHLQQPHDLLRPHDRLRPAPGRVVRWRVLLLELPLELLLRVRLACLACRRPLWHWPQPVGIQQPAAGRQVALLQGCQGSSRLQQGAAAARARVRASWPPLGRCSSCRWRRRWRGGCAGGAECRSHGPARARHDPSRRQAARGWAWRRPLMPLLLLPRQVLGGTRRRTMRVQLGACWRQGAVAGWGAPGRVGAWARRQHGGGVG